MLGSRNPQSAAASKYDLIIVGGGIYGVTLLLEAARRNLKSLLIERGDFGEATSWNSFKIIHGGLRYLQSLDLHRFHESVTERKWFLQHFPDLVMPLKCLMPLYNKGLHRTYVFRIALLLNACLSLNRNRGIRHDRILEKGGILTVSETISFFPDVDQNGLCGGALWYDAVMINSQRIIMEILRWACELNAISLNYLEAIDLKLEGRRVQGVRAMDKETNECFDYMSPIVVNCTGPWSREFAQKLDRDIPELFQPSLAFNMLLDRPPLSQAAIAVTPQHQNARTYFLRPYNDRLFAGTYHATWSGAVDNPIPEERQIDDFLKDLNAAVPKLKLGKSDVLRLYYGLLPALEKGSEELAAREMIVNHQQMNGPIGLYSVSGVKFTTARLVAEKTLRMLGKKTNNGDRLSKTARPRSQAYPSLDEIKFGIESDNTSALDRLIRICRDENVLHLEDLIFRRTDWFNHPTESLLLAKKICQPLGWSDAQSTHEIERLEKALL